eukprot:TRINITY_DN4407_c0_g1_i2.p1 TRINITY_DN4407_c0_g1~~TRINITY_DN4407_c0_g1_i2.p1  ORF type:complete len:496 (+),score=169.47 TRINITY_DN4407_c0_g1_i2:116-1603(+)
MVPAPLKFCALLAAGTAAVRVDDDPFAGAEPQASLADATLSDSPGGSDLASLNSVPGETDVKLTPWPADKMPSMPAEAAFGNLPGKVDNSGGTSSLNMAALPGDLGEDSSGKLSTDGLDSGMAADLAKQAGSAAAGGVDLSAGGGLDSASSQPAALPAAADAGLPKGSDGLSMDFRGLASGTAGGAVATSAAADSASIPTATAAAATAMPAAGTPAEAMPAAVTPAAASSDLSAAAGLGGTDSGMPPLPGGLPIDSGVSATPPAAAQATGSPPAAALLEEEPPKANAAGAAPKAEGAAPKAEGAAPKITVDQLFAELDKNKDGVLEREDLEDFESHGTQSGVMPKDGKLPPMLRHFLGSQDIWSKFDKNGDGKLEKCELKDVMEAAGVALDVPKVDPCKKGKGGTKCGEGLPKPTESPPPKAAASLIHHSHDKATKAGDKDKAKDEKKDAHAAPAKNAVAQATAAAANQEGVIQKAMHASMDFADALVNRVKHLR